MLDRFIGALPEIWRPAKDYEIYFAQNQDFINFFERFFDDPLNAGMKESLRKVDKTTFQKEFVFESPLPPEGLQGTTAGRIIAKSWWDICKSRPTFPMICRLVDLLLRTNPKICGALRATYSYVFMDEFQDTTHVQYDLLKTAFLNSSAVLTAVGDNKQQIMRWAMALDNAFHLFEKDFGAESVQLFFNYRSSPELVTIQHHLAYAIDNSYQKVCSKIDRIIAEDACVIWEFRTPELEARHIAETILSSMKKYQLTPKDFILLVKQKSETYEQILKEAFLQNGLKIRNTKQDILAEPLTEVIIAFLRFGSQRKANIYWSKCYKILANFRGIDLTEERNSKAIQDELNNFHLALYKRMLSASFDKEYIASLLKDIEVFLGKDSIKSTYFEYLQGDTYDNRLKEIEKQLLHSSQTAYQRNWISILDDFEGVDSISIMTIHKSKGLQYHTVIFVGLDDEAWWSFPRQPEESRSNFFVAFSRAKHRVIFTYCEQRGKGKEVISSLYELLHNAGVKSEVVTKPGCENS